MSKIVGHLTPAIDCALCPRLKSYLDKHRQLFPDWHNAPVAPFGGTDAWLLVVGLAPGLRGANCTGRPFTGDGAGDLLYPTLIINGLASGNYARHPKDGIKLNGVRITNAVRCVPPGNKPTTAEINTCRPFLVDEIRALKSLRVILALGKIAHDAVLTATGLRKAAHKFSHNSHHPLPNSLILVDSYHCSRYNVNTRRLTPKMFTEVFETVKRLR